MWLRRVLPPEHLNAESKDAIKAGMGLVATMSALVLGLLVASAKSFYDTQSAELNQLSANVVFLDLILAHYGPETREARDLLHGAVASVIDQMWSKDPTQAQLIPRSFQGEAMYNKIQQLSPKNETQHSLMNQASNTATAIAQSRWLMYEQASTGVSVPLLVVMVFWLSVIFISFGLFARPNPAVVSAFFISALAVTGAILLILNMYTPYKGIIQISSAPLRAALANIGH